MKKQPVLESLILTIRNQKVLLDADLATIYGVETKVLNQAIKRNTDRFPADFAFQLTADEWSNLKSQIVTSSFGPPAEAGGSSEIATISHGGRRKLPHAFTEHGAIMAATRLAQTTHWLSPRRKSMNSYRRNRTAETRQAKI